MPVDGSEFSPTFGVACSVTVVGSKIVISATMPSCRRPRAFIASRSYPRELAGDNYDEDIPIYDESELAGLIRELAVEFVFFAYSDISHREVMHRAALVQAAGASFVMLLRPTGLKHSSPTVWKK